MLVAEGKRRVCNVIEQAVANVMPVVCVHDATAARDKAAEHFRIAMIDIDLPGGGLTLVDELNSISPDTHILLYGENPSAEALEKAINSHVAGFIRLPFETDHLREKLVSLLQVPPPVVSCAPGRAAGTRATGRASRHGNRLAR